MCDTCGCGDPEVVPIEVQTKILAENDRRARHNREHFEAAGVLAINLMGSPGSGKTALLEATAQSMPGSLRLSAVTGDLATERDATRLNAAGIPSVGITTGSACHLDARLVHESMHDFPWDESDLFFIENVGNLVCPAIYDLGQAANVVALSVTEGEDKPLKYPAMFLRADLVVLTKIDLLPYLTFDVAEFENALSRVMPEHQMIPVSAKTGEGLPQWFRWLQSRRPQAAAARHGHSHPHHHHH